MKEAKRDVKIVFSKKRKNYEKLYNHITEEERKVIERLVQAGSDCCDPEAIVKHDRTRAEAELWLWSSELG